MTKLTLQQQLETLSAARYPLHMPGHKRRALPAPGLGCAAWDMTEIDGADDLHDADGILAAAMQRTAALYGSRRCWYLVGGSTVGLLAGIRALAPFGSEVIVARNCHKAVYHALELGQLTAHYLTPPVDAAFGIYGSVPPAAVAAALDAHPQARCVILTSPTYEGVVSDIASIARLCHAHGVPLLVDEAHGAHYLPFAAQYGWQGGAVAAGADLVVQSAHKTLPSLTQTAFLQLNGSLADPAEVERQLDVFETSSPSYPLLVSLDGCTGWLAQQGCAAFAAWRARLDRFDAAAKKLQNTRILCCGADAPHPDFFAHDAGKLLLQIGAAGAAYLRENGFEPEMVCGPNVLAMTSPCDAEDALDRLADVLAAWDKTAAPPAAAPHILPAPGAVRCTIGAALLRPSRIVPMQSAVGQTAAEYLWAYPPGVPLIAPGEEVTAALAAACEALEKAGLFLRDAKHAAVEHNAHAVRRFRAPRGDRDGLIRRRIDVHLKLAELHAHEAALAGLRIGRGKCNIVVGIIVGRIVPAERHADEHTRRNEQRAEDKKHLFAFFHHDFSFIIRDRF